jgi:hypothetical protein
VEHKSHQCSERLQTPAKPFWNGPLCNLNLARVVSTAIHQQGLYSIAVLINPPADDSHPYKAARTANNEALTHALAESNPSFRGLLRGSTDWLLPVTATFKLLPNSSALPSGTSDPRRLTIVECIVAFFSVTRSKLLT